MAELEIPDPGYLFTSILYRHDKISLADLRLLMKSYWPFELNEFSHDFFPMKRYYSKEMGDQELLKRVFFTCLEPKPRDELLTAKLWAQEKEKDYELAKRRYVNIDIGLITVENLQLATSKNFTHRIYLGQGVFSNLEMMFQGKDFVTLPWSYPDYSHDEIRGHFKLLRKKLLKSINLKKRK